MRASSFARAQPDREHDDVHTLEGAVLELDRRDDAGFVRVEPCHARPGAHRDPPRLQMALHDASRGAVELRLHQPIRVLHHRGIDPDRLQGPGSLEPDGASADDHPAQITFELRRACAHERTERLGILDGAIREATG